MLRIVSLSKLCLSSYSLITASSAEACIPISPISPTTPTTPITCIYHAHLSRAYTMHTYLTYHVHTYHTYLDKRSRMRLRCWNHRLGSDRRLGGMG